MVVQGLASAVLQHIDPDFLDYPAQGLTEEKLTEGLKVWADFFDYSIQPGVIAWP
jgi:hypothetical protein